jgi:malonate transporter and related proteins
MHFAVLKTLAPIFIVIGLGFFAGRRGIIDNKHVGALNALVMTFALPASLFVAMSTTARRDMLQEGQLFFLLGMVTLAFFVKWYFVEHHLYKVPRAKAAVQAMVVAFQLRRRFTACGDRARCGRCRTCGGGARGRLDIDRARHDLPA